jgi:hypothetical protein
MLLDVSFPHEPFNALVREGVIGKKISEIMEAIKPEAAYFTEQNGKRGAIIVVDISDPSKIPALAEPFFLTFNADVSIRIAMLPEDLKKAGLEQLGKQWAETIPVGARR